MSWGYDNPDGSCMFGSTDHTWPGINNNDWTNGDVVQKALRYICSGPGSDNQFWRAQSNMSKDEVLHAMRNGGMPGQHIFSYDEYKAVPVGQPNSDQALAAANTLGGRGWCLVENNCMDHSTIVAQAYGVGWNTLPLLPSGPMPWTQTHWAPNSWFDALLPGTSVSLHLQTITVIIHSVWEAKVIVDVDDSSYTFIENANTGSFVQPYLSRPRTMCIHIVPLGGKPIEALDPTGHVSYDVTCVVFYEGMPIGSYRKNGWDPKGTDFSSGLFNV